ncbi:ROK family protein [Paeniglutamicibacter sp. R2-26]|uniref:ROK family protein n=1 Tax=Paeniglutamicibacter sp. R2-26 TaxID=3144417 RepID=UPI003EE73F9F
MRLGLDIGGTKTAAAILHGDGSVAALHTAPSGHGPGEVVAVAAMLAKAAIAEACPVPVPAAGAPALVPGGAPVLESAGACMPGLVDPASGMVRHAVNLGVEAMDLRRGLSEALGMDVSVENDVKAAALGAHALLRARSGAPMSPEAPETPVAPASPEERTLAYLNLGTGLAAAVVRDGQVLRGRDGTVGEIGHFPVAGGTLCKCGQFGCLETLASGSALDRLWRVPGGRGRDPFAAAASGDPVAAHAAQVLCHGIALSLQLLVLTTGAERIVLGGGLCALGNALEDGIRSELTRDAAASDFVASLELADRFELLPSDVPVAALGAALLPARNQPKH